LDVVKARLADAGYGHFEARYDLIGVNAILGDTLPNCEPAEVRARIAVRVNTQAQAQFMWPTKWRLCTPTALLLGAVPANRFVK
jgi:hypothetical protein